MENEEFYGPSFSDMLSKDWEQSAKPSLQDDFSVWFAPIEKYVEGRLAHVP